jgi:hypothetical protein
VITAAALFTVFQLTGSTAQISLSFNSLPSAQGWIYLTSGQSESSIFSADGLALHQNSLGTGAGAGGTAFQYYELQNVVDPTQPFTIQVRARVTGSETLELGGFAFGATNGSNQFGVFMDTHTIWGDAFPHVLSTSIDNTIYHDYLLDATPGVGYKFLVDGSLIATHALNSSDAVNVNRLFLGDATSGGNASADITFFQFTQTPEPQSLLLFASGILTLAIHVFWRRARLRRAIRPSA